MSATNWDACPKCLAKARQDHQDLVKRVEEAYGKVPREEYLAMLQQIPEDPDDKPIESQSLREDYGIGIREDGEFYVSYRARCQTCDFFFEYDYTSLTPASLTPKTPT